MVSVEEHEVRAERGRAGESVRRGAVRGLEEVVLRGDLRVLDAHEVAGLVVEVGRYVEAAASPPADDARQPLDGALEERHGASRAGVELADELHLSATPRVGAR